MHAIDLYKNRRNENSLAGNHSIILELVQYFHMRLLHTVGGYLVAYHTMIVIGATQSGQVKLAAHTSNVCNVLLSGMSCDGCIIYKVFN